MKLLTSLSLTTFLLLGLVTACSHDKKDKKEDAAPVTAAAVTLSPEQVQAATVDWSPEHKKLIDQLISKYGQPNESTSDSIIWNNNGQWFKTVVNKSNTNNPLEQTAKLEVSPEKTGDIALFNKSVVVDANSDMVTSSANKEELNFLSLNLTKEIADGNMSPMEARRQYTQLTDVSAASTRSLNFGSDKADTTLEAQESEDKQ